MLTLLAMMLGPSGLTNAHAFSPDDSVYIGVEPIIYPRFHQERQRALRQGEAWQRFLELEGEQWQVRFEERTGTPLRAWGTPIYIGPTDSAQDAEQGLLSLFSKHEGLLGVSTDALALRSANYVASSDTWYVDFDRLVDGVPVYRGGLTARLRGGNLVMFGAPTHPDAALNTTPTLSAETALEEAIDLGPEPSAAHKIESATLVVLPRLVDGQLTYALTWETRTRTSEPPGIWVSHVDAHSGELLSVYNEVRFITGQLFAEHDLRGPTGDTAISAVPLARVTSSSGRYSADDEGYYSFDDGDTLETELRGDYLRVFNDAGDEASATFSGDTFTWTTDDADIAEIDTYIFLHQVRDWGLVYAPEVGMVTEDLRSTVNIDSSCNAYYDGDVNFYRAGSGCNNTGRIADVNHHEWGHGFHYYSLQAGSFDGSISEGIGDVVAFLQNGDDVVARYFMTNGDGIREVSSDRVYPDDITNEVHADGLIFAGAVWDLWDVMEDAYGPEDGYDLTNELFVNGIKGGPGIPESYDEFILADDDDGDLGNGTPNQCLIIDAFSRHGLGPSGASTLVSVGHDPLDNQLPTAVDYPLDADITNLAPDCVNADISRAIVHYSVDGGDSWQEVELDVIGEEVEGAIPGQEPGAVVDYFIELISDDGDSLYNPAGAEINPHSFYVGELVEIRCDDFEDDEGGGYRSELVAGDDELGANDWQLGTPAGNGGDPAFAWSGDNVWGNDLGVGNYNGEYQNDKHNRLTSAPFDVSEHEGEPLVVQFRRWLSVEDGVYDQAQVLVDGEVAWTNHETRQSQGDEHHLDQQWALHTLSVTDADADGELTLAWDIISDGGLTFGGWNIDDVCVYAVVPPSETPDPEDTGLDGGVDIDPDEELKLSAGCGCASGPSAPASGWAWAGLALALVGWRRRRR